jgi:hypothetical protein
MVGFGVAVEAVKDGQIWSGGGSRRGENERERGIELGLKKKKKTEIGDGGEIFYGYRWVLGIYLFGRADRVSTRPKS